MEALTGHYSRDAARRAKNGQIAQELALLRSFYALILKGETEKAQVLAIKIEQWKKAPTIRIDLLALGIPWNIIERIIVKVCLEVEYTRRAIHLQSIGISREDALRVVQKTKDIPTLSELLISEVNIKRLALDAVRLNKTCEVNESDNETEIHQVLEAHDDSGFLF